MLSHIIDRKGAAPSRVVIIGSTGFIGRTVQAHLKAQGIETLALSSTGLDLTASDAGEALADHLRPEDALIFLSALTPDKGRGPDTARRNIVMGVAVAAALGRQAPAHVVYISSDAVYPFTQGLVNENSPAAPFDLYGAMHLTREIMMRGACSAPVAVLRPTMVFGPGDTHNSYGPNRLRRMARDTGKITLFGNGEETRDHVYIEDVAALCLEVVLHRSQGLLNLVTGQSISYMTLARKIAGLFDRPVEIECTPRQNAVTHRHYDATALYKAFPDFRFTKLDDALEATHRAMMAGDTQAMLRG